MKRVTVNGERIFEVDGNLLNGEQFTADMVATTDRFYHILHQGKSYVVEVVSQDPVTKMMRIKVNNRVYDVSVKDRMDLILEQMGLNTANTGKMKQLKAPMPGLVLDIRVQVGDQVEKGDPLILLEAMKMENVLKAEGAGKVASIEVTKGQNVEKGLLMLKFE
jgi:biotin carboxyl carrier protein